MHAALSPATFTRRTVIVLAAAALPLALCLPNAVAGTGPDRADVPGTAPTWTSRAHAVGVPGATSRMSFQVVLSLRDAAGAAAVARAVSDPHSASYGHYLTPAQFNARFAPTSAAVHEVSAYLSGQGITVTGVAAGNRWVTASATTRQVEKAFDSTLRTYSYKGRTLRASTSALSVPTNLSSVVAGVVGVTQNGSLRQPADAPPPPSTCSTYWDQHEQVAPAAYGKTSFPTTNCGYTAAQVRGAYGLTALERKGDTGKGVTVAIIDAYASPTIVTDTNTLADSQGEPELAAGQYLETQLGPFTLQDECDPASWNDEESLDVQAVHGVAPGATIHYIGAANCDTGIDDAVNYVLQNHVADIVSNSYGFLGEDGLGSEVALEDSEFVQASAEGIGFYFSTGDDGDNVTQGTPHPEPDFPATDPWVTAVGGTSLAVTASNGYKFETSWGDDLASVDFSTSPSSYASTPPGSFFFGGGGGVSALFTEPAYQRLDVPRGLATLNGSTPMRVVPDVAAVADPETGLAIVVDGVPFTYGGTSLACPVFAAVQGVASQGRRYPLGFANPSLYLLGLVPGVFHDVKAPTSPVAIVTVSGHSLLTLGQDTSLTSTRGYDDTTGLGTPNGAAFILGEHLLG